MIALSFSFSVVALFQDDDPLVWYQGVGVTSPRFLYADHQGSVVAVTDANGAAITLNGYDEYGIPQSGNLGRFQYTGQAWLPELGMYHYKARIYSPTLGRFLQTHPIGYDDQINLYAYVGNDPVNNTDPTGMCFEENCPINPFHPELEDQVSGVREDIGRDVATGVMIGATAAEGYGLAAWGVRAYQGWRAFIAAERAISGGRLVLYSGAVPRNLGPREVVVNMRTGWTPARNDRLIASAIRQGRPIRDSHVTRSGQLRPARPDSVLQRERNQLQRAGWKYDSKKQEWSPRQTCTGSLIKRAACD